MSVRVCVCVRQTADANDGTSFKIDRLTKARFSLHAFFTHSLSESYDQLFGLSAHVKGHFL